MTDHERNRRIVDAMDDEIVRRARAGESELDGDVGSAWWPAGTPGGLEGLRAAAEAMGLPIVEEADGWSATVEYNWPGGRGPETAFMRFKATEGIEDGIQRERIAYDRSPVDLRLYGAGFPPGTPAAGASAPSVAT